jgi:hypothetical protein
MLTRHGMCVKPNFTGPVTGGVKVGKLVLSCIACYHVLKLKRRREATDLVDINTKVCTNVGRAINKKAMD